MFYDTAKNDHGLPRDPFKAIVAPRPIGWITSMSAKGEINLAPYSFFNAVSDDPPIVLFSSEGPKDSLVFVRETGEFVCNLATFELRSAVVATSAQLAARRERDARGGARAGAVSAGAPAAGGASPCALECKLLQIIDLRDLDGSRPTATWRSARWSASISTTASSRTAGSTPPRCGRSRAAAMPTTRSSTRCSRSRDRRRRRSRPRVPRSRRDGRALQAVWM